jgi:hypothetical protein
MDQQDQSAAADGQHPPMNGNDELAKALGGGLQFEETPVGGDASGDPAPSLTPAPQMGDPLANMPLPPLPPLDDAKPDDDKKDATPTPEPELPSVHHNHDKGHMGQKDDTPQLHTEPQHDDTLAVDSPASVTAKPTTGDPALDKIKNSALEELKPLVGKLNLNPEEKFDTLLLIIRSTDDQSLLDEAHDAAKNISDEAKRAQALLDIIKEVDYFSTKR